MKSNRNMILVPWALLLLLLPQACPIGFNFKAAGQNHPTIVVGETPLLQNGSLGWVKNVWSKIGNRVRKLSSGSIEELKPAVVFVNKELESVRGGAVDASAGVLDAIGSGWGSLTGLKLVLQLGLTLMNVGCWLIPLRMKKFSENVRSLGIANAFSGGVFLSLAFGHLIPHAMDSFTGIGINSIYAMYATLAGYVLIFFIEKIAFDAHSAMHAHTHTHGDPDSHGGSNGHDHSHEHSAKAPSPVVHTSGVVLLFALAIHSFFETMALGLADSRVTSSLLATSIALHQPAESIALLVALLKSGMSKQDVVKWLSAFSLVGPLGVFVGVLVDKLAPPFVDAIVVGLAAGTFVYVGATEVIAEEFDNCENSSEKWIKFGSLLFGLLSVSAITHFTQGWDTCTHSLASTSVQHTHAHDHQGHFH